MRIVNYEATMLENLSEVTYLAVFISFASKYWFDISFVVDKLLTTCQGNRATAYTRAPGFLTFSLRLLPLSILIFVTCKGPEVRYFNIIRSHIQRPQRICLAP